MSLYQGREGKHAGASVAGLRTLRLGAETKAKVEVWDVMKEIESKGAALGIKKEDIKPEVQAVLQERIKPINKAISELESLAEKIEG